MPKISWNDMNDSDSSLSSQSEEEERIYPKSDKKLPSLSSNGSKLRNACDQLSLSKMEGHQNQDVWLFVPNAFYEQADTVNDILSGCKWLKKLTRIKGVGWNALADYEQARVLITDGLVQDNFCIKFIYSSRNESKSAQNEDKGSKVQKKITYVQKASKTPKLEKTMSLIDEVRRQPVKRKEQKDLGSRPAKEVKPKVRWIEKQKSLPLDEDQKAEAGTEEVQSPLLVKEQKQMRTPKKYVEKEKQIELSPEIEEIKQLSKPEPEEVIPPEPVKEQKVEQLVVHQKVEENVVEVQEPMEVQEHKVDTVCQVKLDKQEKTTEVHEQESGSDVQVQQKKRKKQKKKKTKNHKIEKPDSNNPFSYFLRC